MSWVWDFFKLWQEDTLKSECNTCGAKISRGKDRHHLTTSSMMRHLRTAHGISEPKKRRIESQKPGHSHSSSQPSIEEAMSKVRKFASSHPRFQRITKKVGEMIGSDFLPYSVVENQGFQRLIQELEPRYEMPSRMHLSDKVVPGIYNQLRQKVKRVMSEAVGAVCATTDIWTSKESGAFISLTANFLAYDEMEVRRFTPVLCCKELPSPHTAEAILKAIRDEEVSWGVRFYAVLSDNGSNVTKALSDGGMLNIRCMAHTVNLCVHHALDAQRAVKDTISTARSIVSHYHRSTRDAELLEKSQERINLPKHKLVQDVQTRWNSSYYMLERLVEQREAINEMSYRGVANTLTPNQWRVASSLVRVLEVFEKTTKEICLESATISCILPAVAKMLTKLDKFIADETIYGIGGFMEDLKDQLKRRFVKPCKAVQQARDAYFQNKEVYELCLIASLLDPRVKASWHTELCRADAENLIFERWPVLGEFESAQALSECETSSSENDESMIYPHRGSDVSTLTTEERKSVAAAALNKYMSQRTISKKKCPLQYWEKCRDECPALFHLAVKLLSCPPTSVDSERLFSSAGNVSSPLRNRLLPRNVEILTFLHVNLKKFSFDYAEEATR